MTTETMNLVSREDHESLKHRVHLLSDKVGEVTLEQAKLTGRVESAEASIDRMGHSMATSEALGAATTILGLKLDHLLEKQFDMKKQITWATRITFLLFIGGLLALAWAVLSK